MPSKKQSSTTQPRRRRRFQYFLDRNLGRKFLPTQLRNAGLDITAQDDTGEFAQAERDPWMFYLCGKRGLIVVTSDGLFRKSFPHMAAIALGDTTVIAFTNNSYNADVRARAFLKANAELEKELRKRSRRKRRSFIGIIGMQGSFRVAEEKPMPHRKICDPRDWESYERVCANEGRLPLAPKH